MRVLLVKWGKTRPEEALITDFRGFNRHIVLWKAGSGRTISEVFGDESLLVEIVDNSGDLAIVEYKKYCDYFGTSKSQSLYDIPMCFESLKDGLSKLIKIRKNIGEVWQSVRADAAEVYSSLEKRGIAVSGRMEYPKYSMDVYSGRSKTTGFNLQGASSEYEIRHPDDKYNVLVNFDWIAADMRMAAYMSGDDTLLNCYEKSDPYEHISECLNNQVDRDKCKLALNMAVNSLRGDDMVLKIFPKFGSWIESQKLSLRNNGFVKSVLGRRFFTDGTLKGDRRSFNGTLQGSVAHAMQSSIHKTSLNCGDIIVAEQHDSLTVATPENRLSKVIKTVSEIMLEPLDGIRMPLIVKIGKNWGRYKKVREYR